MNDFDYSKPTVKYGGVLAKTEEEYAKGKEIFESLLAKWEEIFQRDVFFTTGKMEDEDFVETAVSGSGTDAVSKEIQRYCKKWHDGTSLLCFRQLDSFFSEKRVWEFYYVPDIKNKKHFTFKFADYGYYATLNLYLYVKGHLFVVGNPLQQYSAECAVSYANADDYYKALGFKDKSECWGNAEYEKLDLREHFFAAIGKEDVFASAKRFTDRLCECIANEEKAVSDEQKTAEKKALSDALGDL